jgi:hypothetical protein
VPTSEVPPKPAGQRRSTDQERLDPRGVRLGVFGHEPVRREPDGDRVADLERHPEQRVVTDVQMVERSS